jgi:hypothetical protein
VSDQDRYLERRPDLGEWLELSLIGLLGTALRMRSLHDQIRSGDEWHALRFAVSESYWTLYASFSESGSPGLHLLVRLLHGQLAVWDLRLRTAGR